MIQDPAIALSKSFLSVTSTSTLATSFTCAVKDTGIDTSLGIFTFGTTMYFAPQSSTTRQSGGIGIFTNSTSNSGYFIRIKTSQSTGLYGDEVRIFKVVNGNITKTFNDNINVNKNFVGIKEGKAYKVDIFVQHTGTSVKINAYIDGYLIQATDTNAVGNTVIAKSSNISLFANLGTAFFDYVYAIKITQDQFDRPKLTDIYDVQFAKALINFTYGEFFATGIEKVNSETKERYVEEFGSIAREIRYFKKRYDSPPSIPKFTYQNLNSDVKVLYSNILPFQAELYVINNAGTSTLVDSSLGTQINVIGNNFIKNSGVLYQEEQTNKYASQEPIVFESQWIQDEADASQLSTFIKTQWAKSNKVVQLQVFGNPVLSVYDIITVSHQFSEIDPNQKFIITSIKHSWGEGLETTITARSIVA